MHDWERMTCICVHPLDEYTHTDRHINITTVKQLSGPDCHTGKTGKGLCQFVCSCCENCHIKARKYAPLETTSRGGFSPRWLFCTRITGSIFKAFLDRGRNWKAKIWGSLYLQIADKEHIQQSIVSALFLLNDPLRDFVCARLDALHVKRAESLRWSVQTPESLWHLRRTGVSVTLFPFQNDFKVRGHGYTNLTG